jgi:hypothetical protein
LFLEIAGHVLGNKKVRRETNESPWYPALEAGILKEMNNQPDEPTVRSLFIFWGGVIAFTGMFVVLGILSDRSAKNVEPMIPFQECAPVEKTGVSHNEGIGTSLKWVLLISFNVAGSTCKFATGDAVTWHKTNAGEKYRISGFRNSHSCTVREMGPRC